MFYRWVIFCSLLFLIPNGNGINAKEQLLIKDGKIDFSGFNLQSARNFTFNGEWKFFFKKTVSPSDFAKNPEILKKSSSIRVPGTWTNGGHTLYGFATYFAEIKNLKISSPSDFSVRLSEILTSANVYFFSLENGEPKYHFQAKIGHYGETKESSEPQSINLTKRLKELPENFYILINIANFDLRNSGLTKGIKIAYSDDFIKENEQNLIRDNIINGAILIMAIYHFFLFYLRREDTASLYFGIFSLLVFIRIASQGNVVVNWNDLYSGQTTYEIRKKIEYIDLYFLIPFIGAFFRKVLGDYNAKILKASFLISIMFSVVALLTPAGVFSLSLNYYEPILGILIAYTIFVAIRSAFRGNAEARLMLYSGIFLVICAINDILFAKGTLNTFYMLPFGLLTFLFTQSFIISRRFAAAQRKAEYLSENLQIEVEKQTVELRSKNDLIETQIKKIKDDLGMAASVMSAMLPDSRFENDSCSFDCFFQPADELAGDLYGMEARENRLMFWLCDVTGHGVASSMVAGVVREGMASCRFETLYNAEKPDTGQALKVVCEQVSRSIGGKLFATMSLGVYDFESREITISNAAHLKPIHFREGAWDKKSVSKIKNGPLIGYGEGDDIEYRNFRMTLEKDDMLFFYTDGVNEASFDEHSEQFGRRRIVRFLQKEHENKSVLNNLMDEVINFQNKKELDDDITMAILRIK